MSLINFDQNKELDLVLLGRVAVDLNPLDYYCPLSQSTTFKRYVGGSPANIAVGLARLNCKTGFFARVSNDQFGDFVTDYFKNEGIDTSHLVRCENGEKIGLTFTEIKSETQSSILMYRNQASDLALEPADIDQEYILKAKAILISGTSLAQSPSREAALKAVAIAKANGTPIIFDIDYRAYNWKSEDEISVYYSIVAENSDVILGSREEFDLTERFIHQNPTDEQSSAYWHAKKAKIVIIKHGKEGSYAYLSNGDKYKVKPYPVSRLKSFGGGDGYASSFLYGLINGLDIQDALDMASASAAMLVASHACSEDMPNLEKLSKFIKESKAKHGEMISKI